MQCIPSGAHAAALAALHAQTDGLEWPKEWVDRNSILLRYLQAGNRDIATAAQMLAATIKWRELLGVSRALSKNLPDEVRPGAPQGGPVLSSTACDSLTVAPSNRSLCS
jgi:hypothetical protein